MNSIRFVPTAVHGIFDYVGGVGLIASPFIFGFAALGGIAVALPIVLGVGLIAYSLLTNYERSIVRLIPMRVHLAFDFVASAFLAVAPFVFGYSNQGLNVWLPQVIAGVGVIGLVLVLNRPATDRKNAGRQGDGLSIQSVLTPELTGRALYKAVARPESFEHRSPRKSMTTPVFFTYGLIPRCADIGSVIL